MFYVLPLEGTLSQPRSSLCCRKLRKLGLSSLPRVQNPGLVRILLEEVLPHCHITGVEYQEGLQPSGAETDIKGTSDLQTEHLSHTNEQSSGAHR